MSESNITQPARSSAEPPYYNSPVSGQNGRSTGPVGGEQEGDHLRRVAHELGSADSPAVAHLSSVLNSKNLGDRLVAAGGLGELGGSQAISVLRLLLEGDEPEGWEVAVHGLRRSRERDGWLCLESVAVESLQQLASADPAAATRAAVRLMMMGRTKTMDRLFRAADGHSRSIPPLAARRFVETAIASVSEIQGQIISLRLGTRDGISRIPLEVAHVLGVSEGRVREVEAEAWATLQSPRSWQSLRQALGPL